MNGVEYLDIYDENMNFKGKEARNEAHKKGLWHFTFQCWVINIVENHKYILFQKRNKKKQTYPDLHDVTAAGHLTSGENIEDGIRELEEELGLEVNFKDLIYIDTFKQQHRGETFIDNEFCNVFLYICSKPIEDYSLQKEEVAGLIMIEFNEFNRLINNEKTLVFASGIKFNELDGISNVYEEINMDSIVPHGKEYYSKLISEVEKL